MKTLAEIRNTLEFANSEIFTTKEVAKIGGIAHLSLLKYLERHTNLRPDRITYNRTMLWSKEDIIRLYEYKVTHRYRHSTTETPVSETPAPIAPITANPEIPASTEYMPPIDVIIQIAEKMTEDPNMKAFYEIKNRFEQMNETALQKLFKPLLERFKFAYICKQIPEIQSQMLTCIAKGKLRGMDKYKLDFNAFLKLVKFAHDNYVPLDAIDDQKEVN